MEENSIVQDRLADILDAHRGVEGALLPILHAVQADRGWIDDEAKRRIAVALNLSRAEVQGVVSFYHDFRETPEPRPVLKLCRAEACQARGVDALIETAETAAGDRVAIESIYCLGLCSVGPAAIIGDRLYARLDADKISGLVRAMI